MLNWPSLKLRRKLSGGRHDDEVGEGDAGDEEEREEQQDRQDRPPLGRAEGGQHVGVELPEDDRQREDDGAVGRDGQGRRERLGDAEGDQLVVVAGQRPLGDFQQQVVLPEAERQGDAEDDDADDQPGAQLVEVLDEGEAILVGDRLDAAGHPRRPLSWSCCGRSPRRRGRREPWPTPTRGRLGASSSSSWSFSPPIEPLNSRMPRPRLRPSSGSRFGPKTSRAMTRTIAISGSPMFPGILLHGNGVDPRPDHFAAVEWLCHGSGIGPR